MKDGRDKVSMNLNLLTEKTAFEKFEENLKSSIFAVLFVLLKNQDFSLWIEIIFVVVQLLQFLSFPFSKIDNAEMYIITFYLALFLVVLVIMNIFYVSISFSKNKINVVWPLKILRELLSFLATIMFLPILNIFLSIFKCVTPATTNTSAKLLRNLQQTTNSTLANLTSQTLQNLTNTIAASADSTLTNQVTNTVVSSISSTASKVNLYSNSIECWAGTYYIHAILSILVSIFFVIVCIIIQMTFFETKSSTHNHSAKSNSKSDVFMLISKVLTLLLFEFFEENNNQWVLTTVIFFLSAFTFFTYFEEMPYYNDRIMKVYLIATSIYFWNTSCLLLGKVLENTSFDGLLPLFLIGIPIIAIIMLTLPDTQMILLFTSLNKFQKGEKVQKQIKYYLDLVDKREFDRDAKILLKGYIAIYEETCNIHDCALKKYLYNLEHLNMETNAFLLQHAETLFQTGISKFPNCTALRISNAFFLLERLNKKQQANIELVNAEKYIPRFEEQFIIYRYKKILEEQSSQVGDSEENLDIVSNIAYKNHLIQFKNAISKVATLYLDFWSLLLNPNQDNQEDLSKLNDYGSKINTVVEEINTNFEKMQKIKHNDQEVIKIYSDFLADILNDKEKAALYRSRLNDIEGSKSSYDEANLINIDLNVLSQSDEYQYIIISAQPEKLGIITNISLGVCTLFGFSKSELIGKNVEFLMPEVYQKYHRNILLSKINDYRKNTMTAEQLAKNFKPVFKEIFSFGKNKSRYLVPLSIKVAFVPNEEKNDSNFVAKIFSDNFNSVGQMTQSCCVLVNNNFIIQNFTANSVSMLGLNSSSINNGTMEILKFIKEFQEEYARREFDDKSPDQLLIMKRNIVSNRFKNIQPVTWRQYENVKNKNNMSEVVSNVGSFIKSDNLSRDVSSNNASKSNSKYMRQYKTEQHLNLTVTELVIREKHEGYIFKFDTMSSDNPILLQFLASRSSDSSVMTGLNRKNPSVSTTIVNNNPEQEINVKIDKTFVPESQNMFLLDSKKMSYVMNPKNPVEIKENIRDEAAKKLKREKTATEIDSDMLSASEESEDSESENEDSVESSGQNKNSQNLRQKKNEEYFQVNFNNIKFLVYDFKKECLVESKEQLKTSEVEKKKNEDYTQNTEELSIQNVAVVQKEVLETIEEDVIENNKEAVLIKQIEFALNKTENQPTITRMKWISFFIFSAIVTLTSLFLYLFLNSMSLISENIQLIYESYNLISNTVYSIYHVRELILLNNPKYTNIYQKREDYIQNNTNILLNYFSESHDLLKDIITTNMPISETNYEILSNSKMKIFILEENLSLKSIDLTLSASFLETNTALYHVVNKEISGIYPTAKDVYFFMYNSINNVYDKLFLHASIFIEELTNNINSFKYNFLIIFIAASSFSIASYFFISYAFVEVGKRKESYLEVFFEIGEGVIKNSLEKCEKFSKKFQSDDMREDISNLDETDYGLDPVLLTLRNGKSNRSSGSKKRKSNNSREDKIVKIKIFLGLFFISLFFFVIYIVYQRYLETIKTYVLVYNNMAVEQAFYLMILNSLREYFFDRNGYILGQPASECIKNSIDDIYKFKREREKFIFYYKDEFPSEYSSLYDDIMNNNICKYAGNIFNEHLKNLKLDCSSFVSNSSTFGLNILLTHYFEDIRISKFNYDLMLEQSKNLGLEAYYNNTLYGTKYEKFKGVGINSKNQTFNLSEFDPIEIFNDNTVRNLGLVNRFLIKPAYSTLKIKLESTIDNNIKTFQVIYIVTLSLFLAAIFILYVFVWRPFENSLNTTIYKTKNMLSIIPKEVLANLGNIHRLLGIGQNLAKQSRNKTIIAKKIIKQEE